MIEFPVLVLGEKCGVLFQGSWRTELLKTMYFTSRIMKIQARDLRERERPYHIH